jgi:hypothetical protein
MIMADEASVRLAVVAFGVGHYAGAWKDVADSVQALRDLTGELQGRGIAAGLTEDPTSGDLFKLRPALEKAIRSATAEPPSALILLWAGHAEVWGTELRLILADTQTKEDGTPRLSDLAAQAAQSGARDILLLVDACYAGQGLGDALRAFQSVLEEGLAGTTGLWWGVVTAAQPWEEARNGLFSKTVQRLLTDGPPSGPPDAQWDPRNRYLGGSEFIETLGDIWDKLPEAQGRQRLDPLTSPTRRALFVPNPFWQPRAPAAIVEHLLLASRGRGPDEPASEDWFTGRAQTMRTLCAWLSTEDAAGMWMITGGAGTGKSAILGRLVALADPAQRAQIRAGRRGLPPADQDPGERKIIHLSTRGDTLESFTARLAGLVDTQPGRVTPTPAELVQKMASIGPVDRPVVVIDGLDEAGINARAIAAQLLRPLATTARLVIGTRNLPGPAGAPDLISLLGTPALNLDSPPPDDRGDLRRYVTDRLTGVDPSMDPQSVAGYLDEQGSSFLLARVITSQLRQHPVDTGSPGWQDRLASTVEAAVEQDLSGQRLADTTGGRSARDVLAALAYTKGNGVPLDIWLVMTQAVSGLAPYQLTDLQWTLDHLGRYIVVDSYHDEAVYRLAHRELVAHLQVTVGTAPYTWVDPEVAARISQALTDHYLSLLGEGTPPEGHPYLWNHIADHSVDAQAAGIASLRRLVETNPAAFTPDLAWSLNNLGNRYGEANRRDEALQAALEATDLYRQLAQTNPAAFTPDLARSLNNLGVHYGQANRPDEALQAAQQATDLYRQLAHTDPAAFTPNLAASLNNLGNRYGQANRPDEALQAALEATDLYRQLAHSNPAAFTPELAGSLDNLGVHYSEANRPDKALQAALEATDLYRQLAQTNPAAFTPELARSLDNLGNHYGEANRLALEAALQATDLYRQLAQTNPAAFTPDLARSLDNLGIHYGEANRPDKALQAALQATDLYRQLAKTNPAAFTPDLARSLDNLGNHYGEANRPDEALQAALQATDLYRQLAKTNPAAFTPYLTRSLDNLGIHYGEANRPDEALQAALEATDLYRQLAKTNPAVFTPDLARSIAVIAAVGGRQQQLRALSNLDKDLREKVKRLLD